MLAQAQSVSRSLLEQRRIFGGVQDKLVTVGERFPVINGLMNAIRRKKSKVRVVSGGGWCMRPRACDRRASADACKRGASRPWSTLHPPRLAPHHPCPPLCAQDTLVLSGVIAACLVFTLVYVLSKW
jgi:hypothetical protein